MHFHQMAGRPLDPDGQSAGTESATTEKVDQCPCQLQGSSQGSLGKLDGYMSYAEMQELHYHMGELLYRMVDTCLALAMGPLEISYN